MQVVYHLWSETTPDWLRVIADGLSRDDPRVPSVTFLWKGAEWMEREAYDMFGIIFEGNRDLRRIYMPPDYQSFPLRKDFFLPDDAARSPGGGVRPMERTHGPDATPRRRRSCAGRPADEDPSETDADQPAPTSPTDDPRVTLDRELGVFEPVPPYPPRTEREAEFYTLGDGEMFINMGPQHPSTHGVLRVVLKLDGEKVVDLDPVLGYLHRGVEKLCENADYHQAICYTRPARVRQLAVQRVGAGPGLREAARRPGAAPRRVHPGPRRPSSTGSPATPCSSAGWRSTSAA